MKTINHLQIIWKQILFSMIAMLIYTGAAFANSGTVTFENNAQKAGKINAKITFRNADGEKDHCTITGIAVHPVGTTPQVKADSLAKRINQQCTNVTATSVGGGAVKVTSANGNTVTEIDVIDKTNQKIHINPKKLDDGNTKVNFSVTGFGEGSGSALLEIPEWGLLSQVPVGGLPAAHIGDLLVEQVQVQMMEMQLEGLSIINIPQGEFETSLHLFISDTVEVKFDFGGDSGLDWVSSFGSFDEIPPLPVLPEDFPLPPLSPIPFGPTDFGPMLTQDSFPVMPLQILSITPPVMLNPEHNYIYGQDYFAFVEEGIWGVCFKRPGAYVVEYIDDQGIQQFGMVEYDLRECIEGGCCDGDAPAIEIPCGAPDVAVTSSTLGLKDKWGNPYDPDWGSAGEVHEASNIQEAKEAICEAYENNGNQPVSVSIDAHGSPGSFTIGGQKVTMKNLKQFTDGLKGKISELRLFSCETGQGDTGMKFLCHLERLLGCNVVGSTGSNWDVPPSEQDDTGQHWFTDGELTSWEPGNDVAMDLSGIFECPVDPETGWMVPQFFNEGTLPMVEPFTDFGFTYNYPFIPGISPELLEVTPYYPIVPMDWVRLELFDPANPEPSIASQPAILMNNGQIVDPEGAPLMIWDTDLIPIFPEDSIHLRIQSMGNLEVAGNNFVVDSFFDVVFTMTFETTSGDTNFDNVINAPDRTNTWNFRNAVGYLPWDINRDGVVNAQDRTITWNNRNIEGPTGTNE